MDKEELKEQIRERVRPVTLALDRVGVTPMTISITGLVLSILAGWIVAQVSLFLGALVFLIGSALDMLDGDLARLQGTVSRRGAFLDSCFDRLGEAGLFAGLAWYYMESGRPNWEWAVLLILLTVVGSLTTSYVRARAEGVGETCHVGLLQRPERIVLLVVGMILGWAVLQLVLLVLAVATLGTAVQRMIHVARKLPGPEPAPVAAAPVVPTPAAAAPVDSPAMESPPAADGPPPAEDPTDRDGEAP